MRVDVTFSIWMTAQLSTSTVPGSHSDCAILRQLWEEDQHWAEDQHYNVQYYAIWYTRGMKGISFQEIYYRLSGQDNLQYIGPITWEALPFF